MSGEHLPDPGVPAASGSWVAGRGGGSATTAACRTNYRENSSANASTTRMTMATTNPIIVEVSVAL